MSAYKPDSWEIIKFSDTDYRVFAGWRGGYLHGDAWRINSGVVKVVESEDAYFIYGDSGSVYECDKRYYGCSSFYNSCVAANIIDREINAGRDAKMLEKYEAIEVLRKFIKEGE